MTSMAAPDGFDWNALRSMWLEHADRAVAVMAEAHPGETFYVLVFLLDDARYGPTIAMQSFEALQLSGDDRPGDFEDPQWSPFEWGERELVEGPDPAGDNVRLYKALGDYAKDGSRDHLLTVCARHDEVIVDVARAVAERARRKEGAFAQLLMADDFVVFARAHDVARPIDTARLSIDDDVLRRFFWKDLEVEEERAAIARLPLPERIAYLVSRFGSHGAPISSELARTQLAAIGAESVPALVAKLDDPKDGWQAASVLCHMGSPGADAAIGPLLTTLHRSHDHLWAACALGQLGQLDELVALIEDEQTAYVAVAGLKQGRPHSYPHLAELLDRRDAPLTKSIQEALSPGGASYDVVSDDFDAVAAHVASPHACLRKDVASALRSPNLVPANVPLLIKMLSDRTADVRRLAALGLGDLRRDARAALPQLRELTKDRVKAIRETATRALAEIRWERGADASSSTPPETEVDAC